MRSRNKKVSIKTETKDPVKQSAKEKLAEMRANKKLLLEQKKIELEELKLQKMIEEQESQINEIKNKPKNSLSSTVPHEEPRPEVMFYGRRKGGRGRYF